MHQSMGQALCHVDVEWFQKMPPVIQNGRHSSSMASCKQRLQKIYPGKWTLSGLKDELQQKVREFVKEDSHRAQVTRWHPVRGGVAS
ncbi:unnamed protein product, partial [Effrenium voratum]